MDIATIVGLLAAFGLIFMAISENAPAFVDTASLLIVVAGSIAVVMARCSCMKSTPSMMSSLFADSNAEAFSNFCAIGRQIFQFWWSIS